MVLVTGGAGFIGSHTVAALLEAGYAVRVLDNLRTGRKENLEGREAQLVVGDITDAKTVARAMEGCSHVIHLAARPGVPESCADPVDFDHTNVHGTVVVMDQARRLGVLRLVYASSSAVYGSSPAPVKREDQPVQPESPYAVAKAANEMYGATFTHLLGLPCVGLRYFNVFGPRQDPHGPYAAVIPRFVEQALQDQPLPVFGDGHQSRDFVAVQDVARANVAALTAPRAPGQVFNIGTGRRTTVLALADIVRHVTGTAARVEHHPPRPGDVPHSLADIARAGSELGWTPITPFEGAMQETVRWFRSSLNPLPGIFNRIDPKA